MCTYTLKHTETSTFINAAINTRGFKESIQYEFKTPLSAYKIAKVYETLSVAQQESVGRHKQGFKQFVRAIILAYPTSAPSIKYANAARNDEAKRMVSRVAGILNYPTTKALYDTITVGSINQNKYDRIFSEGSNTVHDETEKLLYNHTGDIVMVASSQKVHRDPELGGLYIYAIFYLPTAAE